MEKKQSLSELQKIISLTFDEDPKVRKEAALKLAESDEPAALFALLELSYDKDEEVKKTAREILSKKEPPNKDTISFAEIFSKGAEQDEQLPQLSEEEEKRKKKLLAPIEKEFDKLGKEKGERVKKKLMPTIEKIYHKTAKSGKEVTQSGIQQLISSFVDVVSSISDNVFLEKKEDKREEKDIKEEKAKEKEEKKETALEMVEEIGKDINESAIGKELEEIVESDDFKEENKEYSGDKSIFLRAYELMLASEGDEEVMKKESERLLKRLEEDVKLAFKLAKEKFKAQRITHLTDIKDGMRNIYTDILTVKSVTNSQYELKKKKEFYTRIIVTSEDGSEGVIYLFENRGLILKPGMKVKVEKGIAKFFKFANETAITVGKKGKFYIVL